MGQPNDVVLTAGGTQIHRAFAGFLNGLDCYLEYRKQSGAMRIGIIEQERDVLAYQRDNVAEPGVDQMARELGFEEVPSGALHRRWERKSEIVLAAV